MPKNSYRSPIEIHDIYVDKKEVQPVYSFIYKITINVKDEPLLTFIDKLLNKPLQFSDNISIVLTNTSNTKNNNVIDLYIQGIYKNAIQLITKDIDHIENAINLILSRFLFNLFKKSENEYEDYNTSTYITNTYYNFKLTLDVYNPQTTKYTTDTLADNIDILKDLYTKFLYPKTTDTTTNYAKSIGLYLLDTYNDAGTLIDPTISSTSTPRENNKDNTETKQQNRVNIARSVTMTIPVPSIDAFPSSDLSVLFNSKQQEQNKENQNKEDQDANTNVVDTIESLLNSKNKEEFAFKKARNIFCDVLSSTGPKYTSKTVNGKKYNIPVNPNRNLKLSFTSSVTSKINSALKPTISDTLYNNINKVQSSLDRLLYSRLLYNSTKDDYKYKKDTTDTAFYKNHTFVELYSSILDAKDEIISKINTVTDDKTAETFFNEYFIPFINDVSMFFNIYGTKVYPTLSRTIKNINTVLKQLSTVLKSKTDLSDKDIATQEKHLLTNLFGDKSDNMDIHDSLYNYLLDGIMSLTKDNSALSFSNISQLFELLDSVVNNNIHVDVVGIVNEVINALLSNDVITQYYKNTYNTDLVLLTDSNNYTLHPFVNLGVVAKPEENDIELDSDLVPETLFQTKNIFNTVDAIYNGVLAFFPQNYVISDVLKMSPSITSVLNKIALLIKNTYILLSKQVNNEQLSAEDKTLLSTYLVVINKNYIKIANILYVASTIINNIASRGDTYNIKISGTNQTVPLLDMLSQDDILLSDIEDKKAAYEADLKNAESILFLERATDAQKAAAEKNKAIIKDELTKLQKSKDKLDNLKSIHDLITNDTTILSNKQLINDIEKQFRFITENSSLSSYLSGTQNTQNTQNTQTIPNTQIVTKPALNEKETNIPQTKDITSENTISDEESFGEGDFSNYIKSMNKKASILINSKKISDKEKKQLADLNTEINNYLYLLNDEDYNV